MTQISAPQEKVSGIAEDGYNTRHRDSRRGPLEHASKKQKKLSLAAKKTQVGHIKKGREGAATGRTAKRVAGKR